MVDVAVVVNAAVHGVSVVKWKRKMLEVIDGLLLIMSVCFNSSLFSILGLLQHRVGRMVQHSGR